MIFNYPITFPAYFSEIFNRVERYKSDWGYHRNGTD